MSEDKVVDVAVGVLIREDGRVLLASRPEGKPWAGYWEFPGGKLEPGETAEQALCRELRRLCASSTRSLACVWPIPSPGL